MTAAEWLRAARAVGVHVYLDPRPDRAATNFWISRAVYENPHHAEALRLCDAIETVNGGCRAVHRELVREASNAA